MRDVLGREEIDHHIIEWYRLSKGQSIDLSDPFFRFIAAWVAFNSFYSSRMHDERGDWNQISAYAQEPEFEDQHRTLLAEDTDYAKAVEILQRNGVFDTASRSVRRIRKADNFGELTSCLYQVRCNLFHGGKTPSNMRDRLLVDAAYIITSKLIEAALGIRSEEGVGG